jgi:asparagine synthase (glutamine-hydrolysing)
MCGILGKIKLTSKKELNYKQFKKALDLQAHRGPNDSSIVKTSNFIFGHKRLSIIDLDSHSKQPMISNCKNYTLVFNGEIYNYQELKEDLLSKGYIFNTSSDTEVLLNSFIEYGIECINKFIGMFAFAINDKVNHTTYVVRDRLGIKPLYYYQDSNSFIFSSEIKSILELNKDLKKELNINAISSYMSFRYPILDDTFFKGIDSLSPAHYIRISKNIIEKIEYWNVADKFNEQANDRGEEFYISKLQEILKSAVEYRMIADVPIGSFLSGGVDSSVITALMANNSAEPIKTFTIGFEEKGFNEFEYANIIAKKFDTDHKEIVLSGENYITTMEELIKYKDAPLSVPNEVPLYLMSKELKKYITVVLSGEGADEIFGGYGRIFRSPYDYERIKNIDNLDLRTKEKELLCEEFIKKYLKKSFASEIEHFMNIYSYTSFNDKKELLNNNIDLDEIENKLINKFMYYFNELGNESYYNKLMYTFEKIHIIGLLHRVDTTTMAASVEARVPFVDHRLVEFAFTVPIKYKLKWNTENSKAKAKLLMSDKISEKYDTPKYILKKSYEGTIPNEILYRKKMGFPVPLNNWFGGDFNNYAKKLLLSNKAKERNLYNIDNIEKWLQDDRLSSDHSFAMKIWMLINIELFMERYF